MFFLIYKNVSSLIFLLSFSVSYSLLLICFQLCCYSLSYSFHSPAMLALLQFWCCPCCYPCSYSFLSPNSCFYSSYFFYFFPVSSSTNASAFAISSDVTGVPATTSTITSTLATASLFVLPVCVSPCSGFNSTSHSCSCSYYYLYSCFFSPFYSSLLFCFSFFFYFLLYFGDEEEMGQICFVIDFFRKCPFTKTKKKHTFIQIFQENSKEIFLTDLEKQKEFSRKSLNK